jgi:hypothetical protein
MLLEASIKLSEEEEDLDGDIEKMDEITDLDISNIHHEELSIDESSLTSTLLNQTTIKRLDEESANTEIYS